MIALIDGDLICFRCAASAEKEDSSVAISRCDELLHSILTDVSATSYELWLGGSDNFRKQFPEYKANRTKPDPKWLQVCREHFVVNRQARLSDGVETDDEIGLAATKYWREVVPFVIASLDKDYLQLPGNHYRWPIQGVSVRYNSDGTVKSSTPWSKPREYLFMTPVEARRDFYKQMLIGDTSDNIFGVTGIGKTKADKALDPLTDEKDMYDLVLSLYSDKERFNLNAQLLWILKHERNPQESLLHFQSLHKQGQDTEQSSSPFLESSHDHGLGATPQITSPSHQ